MAKNKASKQIKPNQWPCIHCDTGVGATMYRELARMPVLSTQNRIMGVDIWKEADCPSCLRGTCLVETHKLNGVVLHKIKSPQDFAILKGDKVYRGVVSEFTARISQGADKVIRYLDGLGCTSRGRK